MVRELSKCIDGTALAAYKETLRIIRFVLDTQLFCLKMEPKKDEEEWNLLVYSDSDWSGDSDNHISIAGLSNATVGSTNLLEVKGPERCIFLQK
jgi:hypothetical protein